jgi:hypothetical protein
MSRTSKSNPAKTERDGYNFYAETNTTKESPFADLLRMLHNFTRPEPGPTAQTDPVSAVNLFPRPRPRGFLPLPLVHEFLPRHEAEFFESPPL